MGVEQMRQVNAVGLRSETEQISVPLEAPDSTGLHDLDASFIIAIENVIGDATVGGLVYDIDAIRPVPIDVDDGRDRVASDTPNRGTARRC